MSKTVFIKDNSPEIRRKLKEAGFSVCSCASFKDSIWLVYRPGQLFPFDIHGEGYTDEGDFDEKYSPLKRIKLRLKEKDYYSEDREFYGNVEEFLKHYNPPKK